MTTVQIIPYNITTVATQIEISNINIDLHKTANFTVMLKDSDGKCVGNRTIYMSKKEYKKWDNDDEYAIDYILQQLGMNKIV